MDRRTDGWTMQTLELLLYVMYNNMKPCVSNNFVIDFVFDFLKWLLASMSLVLFFMNKNGQSFRDLSSFHVSKLILSWRHVWCFWQNCTWTGQLTHLNRINDLYSYNCPLRWIHCKEIVFEWFLSDLYSYMLSDRMDIWYRDRIWPSLWFCPISTQVSV